MKHNDYCNSARTGSDADVMIAYGVRESQLIHIADAQRGLSCKCVCPGCGAPLVARKGAAKRPHFAHAFSIACNGAPETVLHCLAKEAFSEIHTVALPEYRYARCKSIVGGPDVSYSALVTAASTLDVHGLQSECHLGRVVPDIIIRSTKFDVVIEIAVTHRVDDDKLRTLREVGNPVIEIRLGPEDALMSREELRLKLAEDTRCKHWLYHPEETAHEEDFRCQLDAAQRDANERRARDAHVLRQGLSSARKGPGRGMLTNCTSNQWKSTEHWVNQFYRRYGRYPTFDESRAFHVRAKRNLGAV